MMGLPTTLANPAPADRHACTSAVCTKPVAPPSWTLAQGALAAQRDLAPQPPPQNPEEPGDLVELPESETSSGQFLAPLERQE